MRLRRSLSSLTAAQAQEKQSGSAWLAIKLSIKLIQPRSYVSHLTYKVILGPVKIYIV